MDIASSFPYSPDLAPSNFHLFPALKKPLWGKHFADADEMKTAVTQWVKDTPREFFRNGIRNLQHRWSKCISLKGEYIEKFDIDSDDE